MIAGDYLQSEKISFFIGTWGNVEGILFTCYTVTMLNININIPQSNHLQFDKQKKLDKHCYFWFSEI